MAMVQTATLPGMKELHAARQRVRSGEPLSSQEIRTIVSGLLAWTALLGILVLAYVGQPVPTEIKGFLILAGVFYYKGETTAAQQAIVSAIRQAVKDGA